MPTPILSSQMSRAQLYAHYVDHSDYDLAESPSPARARIFIQAGRMLLARPLTRSASGGRGGEEVELDVTVVERQVLKAESWLRAHVALTAGDGLQTELGIDPCWREL